MLGAYIGSLQIMHANAFEVFDDYDTGFSWMYAIDRVR